MLGGKNRCKPLIDMYTCEYRGQGASQFALQLQQLCLNAQSTVPALPKSKAEMHHPGVTDECGIQLFVYKLDESLHENRSQFQPSEFQAVQNLKETHAAGKLSSFASVLLWSKKTEDDGALRPSPDPLGGAQVASSLRIPMITTSLSCRLTNTPKPLTL